MSNSIYVSGKITGDRQAISKFNDTSNLLRQQGYQKVINPFDLKPLFGIKKYWFYMIIDIYYLSKCESIYMLSDWTTSKGAKIELTLSILLRKKIILQ